MSSLLFDYTNDFVAALLGRHVDKHVRMILGDDAIHRERERVRVRELVEGRHRAVRQVFIVAQRARDRGDFRRRLNARFEKPIRIEPNLLAVDRRDAATEEQQFAVRKLHQLLR